MPFPATLKQIGYIKGLLAELRYDGNQRIQLLASEGVNRYCDLGDKHASHLITRLKEDVRIARAVKAMEKLKSEYGES